VSSRDHFTIGYRELRALVEDLLQPPPGVDPAALRVALAELLRTHCRNCGDLIDALPRSQGDRFCYACVDPTPTLRRAHDAP
jgi:hypothetical protein